MTSTARPFLVAAVAALVCLGGPAAVAADDPQTPPAGAAAVSAHGDHDHSHAGEKLGTVDFPISCAEAAKPDFQRGLLLLHSFGYDEARRAFTAAAAADPACAMAQWGIAMTYYHPIWAAPTPAELEAGTAAAEAAARLAASTERERAYVAAIGEFYRDAAKRDHGTRARAYRDAMAALVGRFPDDDEAAIFHALTLLGTAPPSDSTYAQQKQAAEILGRLLPKHPDHPGIAHYVIHSFDYPELAELALEAARAYARIAPASAHALHMPSHIFTRLGLWKESIASNLDSAAAARQLAALRHPGQASHEELHALDYLEYAYLQIGQDEKAAEVRKTVESLTLTDNPDFAAGFAVAAVPTRWVLERRAWAEAAALAPPRSGLPWQRYPYAQATNYFARALGAARGGDLQTARAALQELTASQAALAAAPPPGNYDWPGHVEALRLSAAGWLAHAEKRDDEAVKLLTQAAELDEKVGKHPVTPGAVLPPREQLADLLLELGRAGDALANYELALRNAPNRFNGLAGAARAAAAAGEKDKARAFQARLVELCQDATSERPELRAARAAAAGR